MDNSPETIYKELREALPEAEKVGEVMFVLGQAYMAARLEKIARDEFLHVYAAAVKRLLQLED